MIQDSRFKNKKPFAFLLFGFYLWPMITLAQDFNLIVCNGPECTFAHLITLIRQVINALVIFSTFLATAAFAWAGIILLTSGGSEAKKDKAKGVFKKVLIGYLWILGAWLLIYTISKALLKTGFYFLTN